MNTLRKKWILNKLLPGVIFFGGLAFAILWGESKKYFLNRSHRYTIGVTKRTYWTLSLGEQLDYTYKVSEKVYDNTVRYNDKSKVPNGRYFVEYYTKDPSNSRLLQDLPVPDSIKKAPDEGWGYLPKDIAVE